MSSTQGKIKLNRWNNGKVIIDFLEPVYPDELGVPVRDLAEHMRQMMMDKIAELDTELANDYTSQSTTVTG
jgi:1-acyl-sn-glycerol-3-phosphate acyltransferase